MCHRRPRSRHRPPPVPAGAGRSPPRPARSPPARATATRRGDPTASRHATRPLGPRSAGRTQRRCYPS
eukprot:2306354-Prymnesium_polylepis.1